MTVQTQSRREQIAKAIANQVFMNPDTAANFICTVADEVSMLDLERIYILFLNTLGTKYRTTNIQN